MITQKQYESLYNLLHRREVSSLIDINNKQIVFCNDYSVLTRIRMSLLSIFPSLKITGDTSNHPECTLCIFDTEKMLLIFFKETDLERVNTNETTIIDILERNSISVNWRCVGGHITIFPEIIFKNKYDKSKRVYSGFYSVENEQEFVSLFNSIDYYTIVHIHIKNINIDVTIERTDDKAVLFNSINIIYGREILKSNCTPLILSKCFDSQSIEQIIINQIIFGR